MVELIIFASSAVGEGWTKVGQLSNLVQPLSNLGDQPRGWPPVGTLRPTAHRNHAFPAGPRTFWEGFVRFFLLSSELDQQSERHFRPNDFDSNMFSPRPARDQIGLRWCRKSSLLSRLKCLSAQHCSGATRKVFHDTGAHTFPPQPAKIEGWTKVGQVGQLQK